MVSIVMIVNVDYADFFFFFFFLRCKEQWSKDGNVVLMQLFYLVQYRSAAAQTRWQENKGRRQNKTKSSAQGFYP